MQKGFVVSLIAMVILIASGCPNGTTSIPDSGILVSSIQIGSEKGDFEITSAGGQLQLFAQVEPEDADDKSIEWSVQDGSAYAQVSADGLVTAVSNGTFAVCASAQDGSGIKTTRDILISGQAGEVRFNIDSENPVSSSEPLFYQLSTDMSFTGAALTFENTADSEVTRLESVSAGTYYVRAFHDHDNNGALSAGDTLTYLSSFQGDGADSSPIDILFIPQTITIENGQSETVDLSIASRNVLSPMYGMLRFNAQYSGDAAEVSSEHQMSLGFSSDPTLVDQTQQSGISAEKNNCAVYLYTAEGSYYAGGFFDADGSNSASSTMPSNGDPVALYDHIEFNGTNQGTAIVISSGDITDIDFILDDTFLYGQSSGDSVLISSAPKQNVAIWNIPANIEWTNVNSFPIVAVDDNVSFSGYDQKLVYFSDENGNNLVELNLESEPGMSRSIPVSDFPADLTISGGSVEIVFSRWAVDTGFVLEDLTLNDVAGITTWSDNGAPDTGDLDNYFAWYASGTASINGTFDNGTYPVEMDLNFEQGWNLVRKRKTLSGGVATSELCTTINVDNLPDTAGWINFLAEMRFFQSTVDFEAEYGSRAFDSFSPGTGGTIGDSGEYLQSDIESMLTAAGRSDLQPYLINAAEFRYGYHDPSSSYVIISHYDDDSYGVFPIDAAAYNAMDGADPYSMFG